MVRCALDRSSVPDALVWIPCCGTWNSTGPKVLRGTNPPLGTFVDPEIL
jgi:hypothetical protein